MASNSTISIGRGEATTRRQPRVSSATAQPPAWRVMAVSLSRNEPIGLVGLAKAASSGSTRVWVTTVAVGYRRRPVVLQRGHGPLDLVADGALGVGHAGGQRHLVQLVAGELGATEDEPDLGTVAVGDHDPVALVEQPSTARIVSSSA